MSKKIRFLSFLLALFMVYSVLVACGKTQEPGSETEHADTNANVPVSEQETDPIEDTLTALRA